MVNKNEWPTPTVLFPIKNNVGNIYLHFSLTVEVNNPYMELWWFAGTMVHKAPPMSITPPVPMVGDAKDGLSPGDYGRWFFWQFDKDT